MVGFWSFFLFIRRLAQLPGLGLGLLLLSPVLIAEELDTAPHLPQPEHSAETTRQANTQQTAGREPLMLLEEPVEPGVLKRRQWSAGQPLDGLFMPTPVLIASGQQPGPVLCLTSAIHGDELNGVEIVRRIMYTVDPGQMSGTIVGVPIVNLHGFRQTSRYLPDRSDLNRRFPGNPEGNAGSRIAHAFFNDIVRHCDWLIDLHTGSFHRTNLPQLRADLSDEQVRELSSLFGEITVLHGQGPEGSLRRAAVDHGIPAITLEAGEPLRLQPYEVQRGVTGIRSVMRGLGMIPGTPSHTEQHVYFDSVWLRADQSGILLSEVEIGSVVEKGDILGSVTDPITNMSSVIRASADGRILGMALNQMVMPGFAAYHLGITPQAPEEDELADISAAEGSSSSQQDRPSRKIRALEKAAEQTPVSERRGEEEDEASKRDAHQG